MRLKPMHFCIGFFIIFDKNYFTMKEYEVLKEFRRRSENGKQYLPKDTVMLDDELAKDYLSDGFVKPIEKVKKAKK